ncbi:MAG: DUF3570 domain-containing protein [Myxococcota bacterium]|nr:DUF3570 domain-containing protein [Myxococcota bacterium]
MTLSALASRIVAAGLVGVTLCAPVRAEVIPQNPGGELIVRGNYWRDRNTRVLNPTIDVRRELPSGMSVGAHYVLDAITSASVAAGVTADQPFTELRHEAGFRTEVPLSRKVRISGSYSYSSESDYWAHNLGLRLKLSLARDHTGLLLGADYGHNTAGKRLGPTGYLLQGEMHNIHLLACGSQVLSPTLLGTVGYEITVQRGFLENPYRPVFVGTERREVEVLPELRIRHALSLALHGMALVQHGLLRHVTFRPSFRLYADSWGIRGASPELSTSLALPPLELRLLVGYYGQVGADFYRAEGTCRNVFPDAPCYTEPVLFHGDLVYTSDVKLGPYSTGTMELQLKLRLTLLSELPHVGALLGRTVAEVTAGMWLADRGPGWQFNIPLRWGDPWAPAGCSLSCGAFYGNLGFYIPL